MTVEIPPADDDRRPDSPARRIDAACDRFEAAWRAGQDPRIEDFLDAAAEAERPALLRELITLEVELRRGRGEHPTPGEYRDRFPGQISVVDAALAETALRPGSSRPRPSPNPENTSRSLLFGLLALQNNFIDRDALLAAFNAWVADRSRALGRSSSSAVPCHRAATCSWRRWSRSISSSTATIPRRAWRRSARSARSATTCPGSPTPTSRPASLTSPPRGRTERRSVPDRHPGLGGDSTSAGTRFRILRPHAKGGLGEVFVALDNELNRDVALKEIQDQFADDPGTAPGSCSRPR